MKGPSLLVLTCALTLLMMVTDVWAKDCSNSIFTNGGWDNAVGFAVAEGIVLADPSCQGVVSSADVNSFFQTKLQGNVDRQACVAARMLSQCTDGAVGFPNAIPYDREGTKFVTICEQGFMGITAAQCTECLRTLTIYESACETDHNNPNTPIFSCSTVTPPGGRSVSGGLAGMAPIGVFVICLGALYLRRRRRTTL